MTPDLSKLRELVEAGTSTPWSYRPEEHDDWGFIRGPERDFDWGRIGPIVAISREGGTESSHDEHRRDKTDPYEPNGRLIVAAVNALPHLIAELTTAREALTQIERLGSDGEHSGDRHARCRDIARTALRSGEKDHG